MNIIIIYLSIGTILAIGSLNKSHNENGNPWFWVAYLFGVLVCAVAWPIIILQAIGKCK